MLFREDKQRCVMHVRQLNRHLQMYTVVGACRLHKTMNIQETMIGKSQRTPKYRSHQKHRALSGAITCESHDIGLPSPKLSGNLSHMLMKQLSCCKQQQTSYADVIPYNAQNGAYAGCSFHQFACLRHPLPMLTFFTAFAAVNCHSGRFYGGNPASCVTADECSGQQMYPYALAKSCISDEPDTDTGIY